MPITFVFKFMKISQGLATRKKKSKTGLGESHPGSGHPRNHLYVTSEFVLFPRPQFLVKNPWGQMGFGIFRICSQHPAIK